MALKSLSRVSYLPLSKLRALTQRLISSKRESLTPKLTYGSVGFTGNGS